MLRLLFCTVAIIPVAIIPWMTSEAETLDADLMSASFSKQILGDSLDALSDCERGELPVFFRESLLTSHSAQSINDSIQAAEKCGPVTVTVVPLLPHYADDKDRQQSDLRTTELLAYVDRAAEVAEATLAIELIDEPVEEDISTLYINGRAAILRIDPEAKAG